MRSPARRLSLYQQGDGGLRKYGDATAQVAVWPHDQAGWEKGDPAVFVWLRSRIWPRISGKYTEGNLRSWEEVEPLERPTLILALSLLSFTASSELFAAFHARRLDTGEADLFFFDRADVEVLRGDICALMQAGELETPLPSRGNEPWCAPLSYDEHGKVQGLGSFHVGANVFVLDRGTVLRSGYLAVPIDSRVLVWPGAHPADIPVLGRSPTPGYVTIMLPEYSEEYVVSTERLVAGLTSGAVGVAVIPGPEGPFTDLIVKRVDAQALLVWLDQQKEKGHLRGLRGPRVPMELQLSPERRLVLLQMCRRGVPEQSWKLALYAVSSYSSNFRGWVDVTATRREGRLVVNYVAPVSDRPKLPRAVQQRILVWLDQVTEAGYLE